MNKKLQTIEQAANKKWPEEKFKALCEGIIEMELSLMFMDTDEALSLVGPETILMEKDRLTKALEIRRAEKEWLEKQIG